GAHVHRAVVDPDFAVVEDLDLDGLVFLIFGRRLEARRAVHGEARLLDEYGRDDEEDQEIDHEVEHRREVDAGRAFVALVRRTSLSEPHVIRTSAYRRATRSHALLGP